MQSPVWNIAGMMSLIFINWSDEIFRHSDPPAGGEESLGPSFHSG